MTLPRLSHNSPTTLPQPPPALELTPQQRAVDPTWTMLRVDLWDAERGAYRPAGALSIFAIHGTGIPAATDLFDGDIFAPAERGLEFHIDSLNDRRPGFRPKAVHLVSNGTSGDVSPDWPESSRCGAPEYGFVRRPGGPRVAPTPEAWRESSTDSLDACLALARSYVEATGRALARRAVALFERLGSRLRSDVRLGRAFRTVRLRAGAPSLDGLCPKPRMGTAAIGGSEHGYTRYHGWRFLGFTAIGYEEGGSAVEADLRDCHHPKRTALHPIHDLIAGPHGFPEMAQFAALKIGEVLLAAVPAEITVAAGVRMKSAMQRAAAEQGLGGDSVVLITLANGHLQYVTTPEEYAAQHYEGASTIYGPKTSAVFELVLAGLVADLRGKSPRGTPTHGETIIAYLGKSKKIFPDGANGPPPDRVRRRFEKVACSGDTVLVSWTDVYPGRLVPAGGPVLRIEREIGTGRWETVAWDDDARVEVRAISPRGRRGYEWEALWAPEGSSGRYRFVLTARGDLDEIKGESFHACPFP